jgi:antitoxin (DNA-binding transcriptional repressor) of toxin-antitoxin stability system
MDVSIRELKTNPARAIGLMQQGERVRITSHRKVVAELVPPGTLPEAAPPHTIGAEDAAALARLMASGLVAEPPAEPYRLPVPVLLPPSPDGKTMSDLVIALRGPQ